MSDNNVKKTRFDGLEVGGDGQVRLKSADVPSSELIAADPQSGGEKFNGGGELQAQFLRLKEENTELAAENQQLKARVTELEAAEKDRLQAQKEEQDRLAAEKEIEELKAKLDAANVSYRANASKESLQKLVDDLPK